MKRENLANLVNLAKQFKYDSSYDPTNGVRSTGHWEPINQQAAEIDIPVCLDTIKLAMNDLGSFVKEVDLLREEVAGLSQGLAHIYYTAFGERLKEGTSLEVIVEKFEDFSIRYKQAFGCLHNIAHNLPVEKGKDVALRFMQGREYLQFTPSDIKPIIELVSLGCLGTEFAGPAFEEAVEQLHPRIQQLFRKKKPIVNDNGDPVSTKPTE